jgi:urease accessory protein
MSELSALLQLADAAFPAGAFAHSFGLETAIVEGRVHDAASLDAWLRAYLDGVFASFDGAAFVLAARDGVAAELLDDRLAVSQPNEELRRANSHLARATLATFGAMGLTSPRLDAYAALVDVGACDGAHVIAAALGYEASGIAWRTGLTAHATTTIATLASVAAALGYRAIGARPADAVCGYLSAAAAALAAVAARAVPLGQRAIARVRWEIRPAIEHAVARAAEVTHIDELAMGAPQIEIDGLRHRLLDGRLFAS